ncbi:EscS/YscS/HrcS family type III secretion system export apparatus protein [Propionivibrio soli]|jgi:type III secretion protein S|uniref:EscS/YscS/HrcS family type III secretion system export apparatus protein n=1 Tax=Propionivibrio soli TaxID=2976531 RepID=UPI0021E829E4|nr:flagellar biosynthetic protein FliQ [Propionivibrio soli]
MTPNHILDITREGLLVVLAVSLPIVVVATVSSLLVAVVQAVTQIQDQSIGQNVRLLVVMIAVVIGAGVLGSAVLRFSELGFQTLVEIR